MGRPRRFEVLQAWRVQVLRARSPALATGGQAIAGVATGPWATEGWERREGAAAARKKEYRERWGDVKQRKEKERMLTSMVCNRLLTCTACDSDAWNAAQASSTARRPSPKCYPRPAMRRVRLLVGAGLTATEAPKGGCRCRCTTERCRVSGCATGLAGRPMGASEAVWSRLVSLQQTRRCGSRKPVPRGSSRGELGCR